MRGSSRLAATVLLVSLASGPHLALGQGEAAPPQDPQDQFIRDLVELALQQQRDFHIDGEDPDDSNNPAASWVPLLWSYWERHRDTPAARRAALGALNLQATEDPEDLFGMARLLPADDRIWMIARSIVSSTGHRFDRFEAAATLMESVLAKSRDPLIQAGLSLTLAGTYVATKKPDKAAAALRLTQRLAPKSWLAQQARGDLHALENLAVGQPAPEFRVLDSEGQEVALADFAGQPLLLVFWASW